MVGIGVIVLVFVLMVLIVAIGPPGARRRRGGARHLDRPHGRADEVSWPVFSGRALGSDGWCNFDGGGDGGGC